MHSRETTIQTSLSVISEMYGEEVTDYVERVVRAESKSNNLEPEEVISIAYIVLDRVREKFDSSKGAFKNYAIRSLKNELIRSKSKDFFLMNPYEDSEASPIQQVASEDSAFSSELIEDTLPEHEIELKNRKMLYLALSASLIHGLTALEKSLVYYVYYSTDSSKLTAVREFARSASLQPTHLVSYLSSAMQKIRKHFDDNRLEL